MTESKRRRERVRMPAAMMLLAACAGGGGGAGAGADGPGAEPEERPWTQVSAAPEGTGPVLTISGTLRRLEIEGGVYVIEDEATGSRYNPTNLPETFRTDGMAVEAEGRRRDDMMSIGMVGPMVELVRIRERADAPAAPGASGADALAGTSWRLEDLAGAGVIEDSPASIGFPEPERVTGSATCNRFSGNVTVSGDAISFGPLATTRRACPEPQMNQEGRFLQALGLVRRFEVKDGFLLLHGAGGGPPLRFARE
jgi:heat shock protein HslJ